MISRILDSVTPEQDYAIILQMAKDQHVCRMQ